MGVSLAEENQEIPTSGGLALHELFPLLLSHGHLAGRWLSARWFLPRNSRIIQGPFLAFDVAFQGLGPLSMGFHDLVLGQGRQKSDQGSWILKVVFSEIL